ncbi:MAG: hypothetical protein Q9165_005012 [Trypethelium subeluteriae]
MGTSPPVSTPWAPSRGHSQLGLEGQEWVLGQLGTIPGLGQLGSGSEPSSNAGSSPASKDAASKDPSKGREEDDDDDNERGDSLVNRRAVPGRPLHMAPESFPLSIREEAGSGETVEEKEDGDKGEEAPRTKHESRRHPALADDLGKVMVEPIKLPGEVESVLKVDAQIVIQAAKSGEEEVVDTRFPLCLENKVVIGVISDIVATLREPRYVADFESLATHPFSRTRTSQGFIRI